MKHTIPLMLLALSAATVPAWAAKPYGRVRVADVQARRVDGALRLTADVVLDSVELSSRRQLYITPVLGDTAGHSEALPSLLVNGRSMQIAWERGSLSGDARRTHAVSQAVRRRNGRPQTVGYTATAPIEQWMWSPAATVTWKVDSCGCGHDQGSLAGHATELGLNPAARMRVAFVTPAVTELPVSVHNGEATVQFEVNRSVLHDEPYRCADGRVIDNRAQLRVIDDSVAYALSDPNVEIAGISICGYASPEGSYIANDRLATDRSRALSEYIAARHGIPADRCRFDAVAENWAGLRAIVEADRRLSESQRGALLALIDRPAYGPADYDAKERELRTDPKFAHLYKELMLPEWFPRLRATRFEIATRLKPLDDEALAGVIRRTPEKMSLNQMFRVARLYPEGSDDFNRVIDTALRYWPDDETANLNAAAAALRSGDLERAGRLLHKAGDSPEAANARGVLAAWRGEMEEAARLFKAAGALPEAAKNAAMLSE